MLTIMRTTSPVNWHKVDPLMRPVEKAYAATAEGQVHLRRSAGLDSAGTAASSDLPLVMLHASPASSVSLMPLLRAMPAGRALFAFDTPCNGQSCAPAADDPQIGDFADMLDRACDDLGLGEIAIYGTHTGAHIAIAWALARPDRVKLLALDGVALLDQELRDEFLDRYAPPKAPDDTGSQFHWAWQYVRDQMIFFPHYRKDAAHQREGGVFDAETLHELVLDVLNNLESYHLPYRAVFAHDVRADLAKLSQPVLVMSEAAEAGNAGNGPLDAAAAEVLSIVGHAQSATGCDTASAKAAAVTHFLAELDNG